MEFLSYGFMQNALIAICIITPLFGILGTMIVNNRMAFFSDALGHSALTGMAIGVLLGIAGTDVPMLLFALAFALILNHMKRKSSASTDTIISVFSSLGTAVGLVILSRGGNFSKYSALLVGDILSITAKEILCLLGVLVLTIVFWLVCFNKLHTCSVNKSLAMSKGVPVRLIEDLFAVLIAVIVMLSIKWVGILIINALLILPTAAASNISANMREYHLFSVILSAASGLIGLVLAYYLNAAVGPTIVIVAAVFFAATFFARPLFRT